MTYLEHQWAGERLTGPDVEAMMRSLGNDSRFAAVVTWLERNRDDFVAAGSRQALAADYGKLAHGQGSVHAINVMAAQLAKLLGPTPISGGFPIPAPEDQT
jgi:hypothetical protein